MSDPNTHHVFPPVQGKKMLTDEEIENRFGFHKATIEGPQVTTEIHAELRRLFKSMVKQLNNILPPGRNAAEAFTNFENASMWAHKAIAELSAKQNKEAEKNG